MLHHFGHFSSQKIRFIVGGATSGCTGRAHGSSVGRSITAAQRDKTGNLGPAGVHGPDHKRHTSPQKPSTMVKNVNPEIGKSGPHAW